MPARLMTEPNIDHRSATRRQRRLQLAIWSAIILLVSGSVHLAAAIATGNEWEGAVSFRKPALFGISAGMTAWSIAWVASKLKSARGNLMITNLVGVGLLIEVALITIQFWRGVPSHFNRQNSIDAAIEAAMLMLILAVTLGICWITFRSIWLRPMPSYDALAIRGGLVLLVASCLLGGIVTIAGEINQRQGLPLETWGAAGVLKYPHGAAMHALQLLPVSAWILSGLRASKITASISALLGSQFFLLASAIWQTAKGYARFDFDLVGGSLLLVAGLLLVVPIITFSIALIRIGLDHRRAVADWQN